MSRNQLRTLGLTDIDAIATRHRSLSGVRCRLCAGLHPDRTTTIDAIPVTAAHRTFLDLVGYEPAAGPSADVG
jgi:hypothetical protein